MMDEILEIFFLYLPVVEIFMELFFCIELDVLCSEFSVRNYTVLQMCWRAMLRLRRAQLYVTLWKINNHNMENRVCHFSYWSQTRLVWLAARTDPRVRYWRRMCPTDKWDPSAISNYGELSDWQPHCLV